MKKKEFNNLITRYSQQVLVTAMRIVRDENVAGDVHQEVFLSLWQHRRHWPDISNWDGYLYRVTIRKALEQIKKMKPFSTILPHDDVADCGGRCRPDHLAEAAETQVRLSQCISRLSEKQAQAFTLLRIEGLDYPQAATIMACKEETVRVHLHRALKELAILMRPYLEEGGVQS